MKTLVPEEAETANREEVHCIVAVEKPRPD